MAFTATKTDKHDAAPRSGPLGYVLCVVLAAALVACDNRPRDPFNPDPDAPSYNLGLPDNYRKHGMYFDFVDPEGILLVSRPASGGTMLVALDYHCTYDQQPLQFNELTRRIECNRCASRWTTDGLVQSGSVATHSLPRYRLRLAGTRMSEVRTLYVDTSRRYYQKRMKTVGSRTFEVQQWSATDSMFMFEKDPRLRSIKDHVATKADQEDADEK